MKFQLFHTKISNTPWVAASLLIMSLMACNLTQEIEIDLPPYSPEPVVESYLIPGQPYLLTIANSLPYFESVQLEFIDDAVVEIRHRDEKIELIPFKIPVGDSTSDFGFLGPIVGDSIQVYAAFELVPENYNEPFELSISGPNGLSISAETFIPSPIPVDSNVIKFDDKDSLALMFTYFTDDPSVQNFYRRTLHLNSLDSVAEQDFVTDDSFLDSDQVTFGSGFDYSRGDTLISTLYHIPEAYFRFEETVEAAITANLSPFAQPSVILTNIEGGTGIFTGLTLVRDEVVIE